MGILRRFREWREDKDGVLTGPDINAESVDTDSATIGSASSVSGGPVGDSGEKIPLTTISFGGEATESTTSTSNVSAFSSDGQRWSCDYDKLESLTNIGDIYFQGVCRLKIADASASAKFQIRDGGNSTNTNSAQTSSTSFTRVAGGLTKLGSGLNSPGGGFAQLRSTDGNHAATATEPSVVIYGEIA